MAIRQSITAEFQQSPGYTTAEYYKHKQNNSFRGLEVLPVEKRAGKPAGNFKAEERNRGKEKTTSVIPTRAKLHSRDIFLLLSSILLLIGAVIAVVALQPAFQEFHLEKLSTWGGSVLFAVTITLMVLKICYWVYMLILFLRYKAVKSVSDDELPTCTVIVPAYNESKQVLATLISLAESDYPSEKLQIISIDDGSTDDTWYWMQEAKAQLGNRVSIYQQPNNQGKRHALFRGFHLASNEIFVTVDSDSVVKKDTLRNLVSPFYGNQNCGAVAGNVQVLNNKKAVIPRMLNVSFLFSFEFVRSSQSVLGSVFCTPGALAAYRREAVMQCLPEWINQNFMGYPSDIGEDRAMTNMILKQGYHVLFQRNAVVYTNIPEKFKGLYRMYIRWERSNVRENIAMSKFVFKSFREENKTGTRIIFINQCLSMLTAYPFLLVMFSFLLLHPLLFISSTLTGILISASIPAFFYARKYNNLEAFWAYSYSILYTFALFWITPYAIATVKRRGWLTRGLPELK